MGQLANELRNQPQGTLLSDTVMPRPKKEQVKAVTLRSGNLIKGTTHELKGDVEPSSSHIGAKNDALDVEKSEEKKIMPDVEPVT